MIVSVCAQKGSPGVTTLTLALAVAWSAGPGAVLLLEADTSGADLPFRLRGPGGRPLLGPEPSVLSLAVDTRTGLGPSGPAGYAQPTPWGVGVIPGPPTAAEYSPIGQLWPQVAAETAAWPGLVLADLGRLPLPLGPSMPAPSPAGMVLAAASRVVLVVTRASVEGFYRTRDLVAALTTRLPAQVKVGAVIAADLRTPASAAEQLGQVLAAAGSPAAVAGVFGHDPAQEQVLREGGIPRRSRLRRRGDLWESVHGIVATVTGWDPALAALAALAVRSPDHAAAGLPDTGPVPGGGMDADPMDAASGRSR